MKKFYSSRTKLGFALLVLLLTISIGAKSNPVDAEKARLVAKNFLNINDARSAGLRDVSAEAEFSNVYVFTTEKSFVLVAADDRVQPILGYSLNGGFDLENMPENKAAWIKAYGDGIRYAIDHQMRASTEVLQLWNDLAVGVPGVARATNVVNPLVQTKWNQGNPYNMLCPSNSVTGCVATAMAQVMKYWNYPERGIGSHSYIHANYGELSADFQNTTYDWANMTNTYSSSSTNAQKMAVATLMYHCGVSVNMDYSPSGSGAVTALVADALKNYFNYSSDVQYHDRDEFDDATWISMLKNDLNLGRPIQYCGSGSGGGHSFVFDGYNSNNYFHVNWGWGGSCDEYYSVDNLNPGPGGIGSGSYGVYNERQGAIFGIHPSECTANAPTNLTYTQNGRNITLSWSAASGAASYNIYRDNELIGNVSANSYSDLAFYGNSSYYVRSMDSNGWLSLSSNIVTVTVDYQVPVVDDLAVSVSGNNVNLSWTAPEWCYPQTPSQTLSYGIGGVHYSWTSVYYAHRYPASMMAQYVNKAIYKVSTFIQYPGTYTVYIYTKSTSANKPDATALAATKTMYFGLSAWRDIVLDSPVMLTEANDLWVVMKQENTGQTYPTPSCDLNSYNANACYASTSSPTAVSSITGYTISWLIQTCLTDGTYTYNIYRDNMNIAGNVNGTSYSDNNLAPGSYNYYVKTNYYAGETNASNQVTAQIGSGNYISITASANPPEGGEVSGAGSYIEGGTCTLSATANEGFTFVNWTEGGVVVSASSSFSFSATHDATFIANFEPIHPVAEVVAEYYPDPNDHESQYVKVHWSETAESSMIEDFETGDFSQFDWNIFGDYPFEITTTNPYEGTYCMQSTNYNVGSSTSSIDVTVDIPHDGVMSFYERISCESSWDNAYFYIDGVQIGTYTGSSDWTLKEFEITAGIHNFKWAYAKDSSVNSGDDRFFIDYIDFIQDAQPLAGTSLSDFRFDIAKAASVGVGTPDRANRSFLFYRVYRTNAYNDGPYTTENTVLLADNVSETSIIDETWADAEAGVYKWGVSRVYEDNRGEWVETPVNWVNPVTPATRNTNEGRTLMAVGTPYKIESDENTRNEQYIQYCTETFSGNVGTKGGEVWWGIKIPATQLGDYIGHSLTKLGAFTDIDGDFDCTYSGYYTAEVYVGSTPSATTLVSTATEYLPGDRAWHDIALTTPVTINGTDDLWLCFHTLDIAFPMSGCDYIGEPNSDFLSLDGTTWEHSQDYDLYYTWMIRGLVDSSIPIQVPSESSIVWSNILDKDMNLGEGAVNITVTPNSGDSPEGTVVSFTNLNPAEQQLYPIAPVTLDGSGYYAWNSFRKGDYQVQVSFDGYNTIAETVSIWDATSLNYVLTEIINGISNLYVSRTGWAMWNGATPNPVPSGDTEFTEGFEGGLIPTGWTTIDADGDGYNWTPASVLMAGYIIPAHGGVDCISSQSYDGVALHPDNYLVSPQASIANGSTFSFWACAQDPDYAAEHYGVAISTTTLTADAFTTIAEWTMTAKEAAQAGAYMSKNGKGTREGTWYQKTVDLSAFAGQTVWIAIRHFNCSDMYYLNVDDVELTVAAKGNRHFNNYQVELSDGEGSVLYQGTNSDGYMQLPVDNLTDGETYHLKVASSYSTGMSEWSETDWLYQSCDNFDGVTDLNLQINDDANVISWSYPEDRDFGREGSRNTWDLLNSFNCTSGSQYGVATDGKNIYTCSWSASTTSMFYKYDMNGNFVEEFNVSGSGQIRDLTYDGQYFYGVDCSSTIYCLDLANHVLVNSFTTAYGAMRCCSYDSERDGFWVVGNWSGSLAFINRSGAVVMAGPEPSSASGVAYYKDANNVEHVYCFNNGTKEIYDYDIASNTIVGSIFDFSTTPGNSDGSAGGCHVGYYGDKIAFFGDLQQSPNLIGIYELREIVLPVSVMGAMLYRDGELLGFTTQTSYTDAIADGNHEYEVRVVYNGNRQCPDLNTYYAMSCPQTIGGEHQHEEDFAAGWNWWSTYVDLSQIDGLEMLEESLGSNGYLIKSNVAFVQNAYATMGMNYWFGNLSDISNDKFYKVNTTSPCTVAMAGSLANPSHYPITINSGWNWIGFPSATALSIETAFTGFTPTDNDVLKSQTSFAIYYENSGWFPNGFVLNPGDGFMYYSASSSPKTLTFSSVRDAEYHLVDNQTYWKSNVYRYADNASIIATANLDGMELAENGYEVSAFVNGECRGSGKLIYAEPVGRYVVMLSVSGNDGDNLSFALYDANGKKAYCYAAESVSFAADALYGLLDNPMALHFNSETGVSEECAGTMTLFPNPVERGGETVIAFPDGQETPESIEIINVYGEIVRKYSGRLTNRVKCDVNSGVYMVRVVMENDKVYIDKLIVK